MGLADSAGSKFRRMANWPSFVFFFYRNRVNCTKQAACFETGPVGHPLEFEPAKSANPTRFLSKIDQWLIEGEGDVFLTSPGEKACHISVEKSRFIF